MGYQDITLYKLKFEAREGLEVTAEGLSAGDLLDAVGWAQQVSTRAEGTGLTADDAAALTRLMTMFASALFEWNVEDRQGQPVPRTVDGLRTLKLPFVMDMINAWMSAQTEVDDDLGKDSSSGPGSVPAPPLPMAPLSPSPGN